MHVYDCWTYDFSHTWKIFLLDKRLIFHNFRKVGIAMHSVFVVFKNWSENRKGTILLIQHSNNQQRIFPFIVLKTLKEISKDHIARFLTVFYQCCPLVNFHRVPFKGLWIIIIIYILYAHVLDPCGITCCGLVRLFLPMVPLVNQIYHCWINYPLVDS